ncbi:hypothetical protein M422DRAFT_229336 [Sphaerobolus stellatus SS14]|uniref:Ubiquitin-like protease family profile domain-containing protein n=1 Tax=Sphaerobolus stellatus (strain SS14) TaxID=990650 RepID=A0A0C9VU20_SPHS4|nr:hypothetical protein M422DRAFT_229336 [Sphaerobolus stellatus SS14]
MPRPPLVPRRAAKRRKITHPQEDAVNFKLTPSTDVAPRRKHSNVADVKPSLRQHVVMAGPYRQGFAQKPDLPIQKPGLASLVKPREYRTRQTTPPPKPRTPPHITGDDDDDFGIDFDAIEGAYELRAKAQGKANDKRRHRERREAQSARWQQEIIPLLIRPYLMLCEATENGRIAVPEGCITGGDLPPCTCGKKQRRLRYVAAFWDHIENQTLLFCQCRPAAVTLIRAGLFPCAPLQPSIAFDVNLMELITYTMSYITPNLHGWALSLEWFWKERGYILGQREALRKRFGNAFHWFTYLLEQVAHEVQETIHPNFVAGLHLSAIPAPSPGLTPSPDMTPVPEMPLADIQQLVPPSGMKPCTKTIATESQPLRMTLEPNAFTEPSPHHVEPLHLPDVHQDPSTSQTKSTAKHADELPSQWLQDACPACFGGCKPQLEYSKSDVIVCLDANFTQKCLQGKYTDPPVKHPYTLFIDEEEVKSMEAYLDLLRNTAPSKQVLRSRLDKLRSILPDHILDECERSFTAANEKTAKASGKIFADTGLMALVCRHDRVLWVTNMTTPGERQFYAFALIDKLFQHLPKSWHVGLLYDIGCQIERSMAKHSILPPLYSRLTFAVSVFHAYGHQWSCQVRNHPRKRAGYGLSDGEGCERFWSSMRRLIPSLRVSGRHRRRWTLDRQFRHFKFDNLRNLASIMKRKYKACDKRMKEAKKILQHTRVDDATAKREWALQVEAQTAKLKRQSKNAADKEIEGIIDLREEQEELRTQLQTLLTNEKTRLEGRLKRLRQRLQKSSASEDVPITTEDIEATHEALKLVEERLAAAERSLGVPEDADLKALRGNVFLRHRVNARAVKERIRSKVVAHKFERGRLERVYRNHVMHDKDHQQAKTLLKRTQNSVSTLVSKFNHLVEQMEDLQRRKIAPAGVRVPARLQVKPLFRLDVDDNIWNDDGLLDEDGEVPEWLGNQNIRDAIPAYLEKMRVIEERERLDTEVKAVQRWLQAETTALLNAKTRVADDKLLLFQIDMRLRALWNISEHWRRALDPDGNLEDVWLQVQHVAAGLPAIITSSRNREIVPEDDTTSSDESSMSEDGLQEQAEILAEECDHVIMRGIDDVGEEEEYVETDTETGEGDEDDMDIDKVEVAINFVHAHDVLQMSGQPAAIVTNDGQQQPVIDLTEVLDTPPARCRKATRTRANHARGEDIGKVCGAYSCFTDDIERVEDPHDRLFEGRIITVVAEALLRRREGVSQAQHLPSLVLHSMRQILNNPGDHAMAARETRWVTQQLDLVNITRSRVLLIPAFVPGHWTLVAIHWLDMTIRFYDSMPNRVDSEQDEQNVQEEVWALLRLMEEQHGRRFDAEAWNWISETRGARQTNGYDCGAFVLADMRTYFRTGRTENITQGQMVVWRQEIVDILQGLESVSYERMAPGDPGQSAVGADGDEVIVINDDE